VPRGIPKNPKTVIQVRHGLSAELGHQLMEMVGKHVQAQVADSWKGGGDPVDVPIIELEAKLAEAELVRFVTRLVQEGTS
jgi:hypothetical protein